MADLFGNEDHDWRAEWVGMPEFVQERKEPFACINVRFASEDDLRHFAELIGQKLTPKTKSIWHPYRPHRLPDKKVYVSDE